MIDPADMVIDSFAGGGGASLGIERALGRPIDVAINHDAEAVAMHAANHPATRHYCQNIWRADPAEVCAGRRVGVAWFSPDCKHHSKAKGSRPVKRNIRDLAWVVVLWAKRARPRLIFLENVEEFRDWGPIDLEGRPIKARRGETFARWVGELRRLGYRVEYRELRASDYGVPTIRKRLFLIARCDGRPIVWPRPTHGPTHGPGLLPVRTAAECIDWSIPCPSIFERTRPLAEATLRRIARGVVKYVLEAAEPFVIPITHQGDCRVYGLHEPVRTLTTAHRGEQALVSPTLVQTGYGERPGQAPRVPGLEKPLGTVVAGGCKHALVAAFMAQHNTGVTGHPMSAPVSTVTGRGTQQGLVAAHMLNLKGSDRRDASADEPMRTITAGGQHIAEVRAFLTKYYGTAIGQDVADPLHAATAKARFGVVTVRIGGVPYAIADIGMRMLSPRELFRAHGFPDSYIIDPPFNGKPLTKTAQYRMVGNSVCPDLAEILVKANVAAESAASAASGAAA
jgi:DNA (cytosine-5)-methyltransferase 1